MTIGGYIILAIFAIVVASFLVLAFTDSTTITTIVIIIACIIAIVFGLWYFNCTASGSRYMVDTKSELMNGLDRTITVYTANGDVIAQYKGKIDLQATEGGYVKFDFEGKRYIYYNCFVETIADIN